MTQYRPAWMPTYSGGKFYFDEFLTASKLDIEDIAHALAFQCRYNGHTRKFYSVAEHSVRVAQVMDWLSPQEDLDLWCMAGLMHDAAEAYIGDIISPVKTRYFDKKIEDQVEHLVAEQFKIPIHMLQSDLVKRADLSLLATELRDLFLEPHTMPTLPFQPLRGKIEPWQPELAEQNFLELYFQLKR